VEPGILFTMKTHALRLHTEPFNKIKGGVKTIESRLHDEKRQEFQVGDSLRFINREDGDEINTVITDLHHFPTFSDLFSNIPVEKFGSESSELLLIEITQFYSDEEQSQFGVVGIEFKIT
jgi:ASC-1-like (ASCH) protein